MKIIKISKINIKSPKIKLKTNPTAINIIRSIIPAANLGQKPAYLRFFDNFL